MLTPVEQGPKLSRAKPVRLFEQAVEQIRSLILEGTLKPGDKLPSEIQLSEMLDVSRSSVREAFRSLESIGIINVKSGKGTFVAENALIFSSMTDAMIRLVQHRDQLLQLLEVRWALECLSASLASTVITEQELNKLDSIVNRQEALVNDGFKQDSYKKLAHLDEEFHKELSKIGGNEILCEIIHTLLPAFSEDNKDIFVVETGLKLVEEHRQIITALREHVPEHAESAMRRHLGRVIDEVKVLQHSIEKSEE